LTHLKRDADYWAFKGDLLALLLEGPIIGKGVLVGVAQLFEEFPNPFLVLKHNRFTIIKVTLAANLDYPPDRFFS